MSDFSTDSAGWRFRQQYATLPGLFHSTAEPGAVPRPALVALNRPLAAELGLDADQLERPEHAGVFTGSQIPSGALPLAQAYAGHQYGHFTGLGDGRAMLLGEHLTPCGRLVDIHLKGSGRTAYSRGGDGKAALGPMLREFLISEAMHALGIPTTRSLAVAVTGERVFRENELPGAVLTRVAASHIRVGTFEWAAAHQDPGALAALTRHTLERHHPELSQAGNPALALLEVTVSLQAALIARWMAVGFIHGVMNTDNMAVSGETIDYGPCAFMDGYDPATVFSSIDRYGRYAYGNQPRIAQWNLARFAEALLPVIDPEESAAIDAAGPLVDKFEEIYQHHYRTAMGAKIGLFQPQPEDDGLIDRLLEWMKHSRADFTSTFATLSRGGELPAAWMEDPDFLRWHADWKQRWSLQGRSHEDCIGLMRSHNPVFIPRNHKVEEALDAATRQGDMGPFSHLLELLRDPFRITEGDRDYQEAPVAAIPGYRTYCGT